MDAHNQHAAWAPFGKHPVDDRMIHGPLVGIKLRLPVVGSLAAPSPHTSLLFSLWPMERQQEASKKQSGKESRPNRLQSTYGPLEGIKVRAAKRFEMIEKRVQFRRDPGFVMHLERFNIVGVIQESGVSLYANPDI